MTRLLVSVRSAQEAQVALDHGADLIDVKQPSRGPLGPPDRLTVVEVVRQVAGRAAVSVALGELLEPPPPAACRTERVPPGVELAKLGLAGCGGWPDWRRRWQAELERLPAGTEAVAVVYADAHRAAAPPAQDILDAAAHLGCRAILVDTWDKSSGDLLVHWQLSQIARWVEQVRGRGLWAALAGGLTTESFDTLVPLGPDVLAVRSAACGGRRESAVQPAAVARLAQRLAAAVG